MMSAARAVRRCRVHRCVAPLPVRRFDRLGVDDFSLLDIRLGMAALTASLALLLVLLFGKEPRQRMRGMLQRLGAALDGLHILALRRGLDLADRRRRCGCVPTAGNLSPTSLSVFSTL